MKNINKWWFRGVFALVGALSGLAYWYFVGCTSGTCPIRSVWYYSVLWGGLLGYLVGDTILDILKKRRKNA